MRDLESNTSSSLIMPGEATATCWSCGDMRAAHFCSACGKVQPPVPVDYFTFFGSAAEAEPRRRRFWSGSSTS